MGFVIGTGIFTLTGVLVAAFLVVSIAVVVLRRTKPKLERP